jgi:hypothetical protein
MYVNYAVGKGGAEPEPVKSGYEQSLWDRVWNRKKSEPGIGETRRYVEDKRRDAEARVAASQQAAEMVGGRPVNMSSYTKRGTPYFFAKSGMTPTVTNDINAPGENTYFELADEAFTEDVDTIVNSKRFKDNQLPREPISGTESMFRYVNDYRDVDPDPLLDNPLIKKSEINNHGVSVFTHDTAGLVM